MVVVLLQLLHVDRLLSDDPGWVGCSRCPSMADDHQRTMDDGTPLRGLFATQVLWFVLVHSINMFLVHVDSLLQCTRLPVLLLCRVGGLP